MSQDFRKFLLSKSTLLEKVSHSEVVGRVPWAYSYKVLKFSTRKVLMHVFILAIISKLYENKHFCAILCFSTSV